MRLGQASLTLFVFTALLHPQQQVLVHYDYMVLADQGTACTFQSDCTYPQACVDNVCRGHSHKPDPRGIQAVIEAFAAKGIALHIDPVHNAIPERRVITVGFQPYASCSGTDAVSITDLRTAYLPSQNPSLHYSAFGHSVQCPDAQHCSACAGHPDPTSSGASELPGQNFAVTLGVFGQPAPIEIEAGTFQHELGHNFGLRHGGAGDDTNWKPNFVSVMNYAYQLGGILVASVSGSTDFKSCTTHADCGSGALCGSFNVCVRVDYSGRKLATLEENNLDERVGVSGSPGDTDLILYFVPGPSQAVGPSYGPIDWNGDGSSAGTQVAADLNNDDFLGPLSGFDDWDFVKAVLTKGRPPGFPAAIAQDELSATTALERRRAWLQQRH